MIESMFHLHMPILEKIVRPIIVYVCLILFLRLFGKRELAQLNPFDLVVLLSLSNTVQNAIIGDDNTVTGGVIGAFSLLTVNWFLSWFLYRLPKLNKALEGSETVLIHHGVVDKAALNKEKMTELELREVLHKQGLDDASEVERCILEPSGNFYVEQMKPSREDAERMELMRAVESLTREVKEMRAELARRNTIEGV